jgi:hypothetical protein
VLVTLLVATLGLADSLWKMNALAANRAPV